MDLPNINDIVGDRQLFSDFVYVSLSEAVEQLHARRADVNLQKKLRKVLENSVPDKLFTEPRVVLARHLITPNHEVIRFLAVPDSLGMKPLFFEYLSDKLIYKNPAKYRFARLAFFSGFGKKKGIKLKHTNIIDFDTAHGKPIKSVETTFGPSLVDFHHNLLLSRFPYLEEALFDGSDWYAENGGTPEKFYEKFLALFISNGILFENFLLDQKELQFTKEIFSPAFINISKRMGVKPLIVALEPTQIEGDEFWVCHPEFYKKITDELIKLNEV